MFQITNNKSTSNIKTIILIDEKDFRKIDDGDIEDLVFKEVNESKIRNQFIELEHDASKYKVIGLEPGKQNNPKNLFEFESLVRYLDEEYTELFRASDEELRMCLPNDLPKLMHINQWHHKMYYKDKNLISPTTYGIREEGIKPSDYATYRMIADVLVSKDTTKWNPTLEPNNDWRNWLNAGSM